MSWVFRILFVFFGIVLPFFGGSQSGDLVGIAGRSLVQIDLQNGIASTSLIVDAPSDMVNPSLVYIEKDCQFFSIIDHTSAPKLVSIDWAGNFEVVGSISVPGQTVFLAESLAYRAEDDQLYLSASLDGGIDSGDFFSESLLIVDRRDGISTLRTRLATGSTMQTDLDNITFVDNTLFLHDGNTVGNSSFYKVEGFDSQGLMLNPDLILSRSYIPVGDFTASGSTLYFTTSDYRLYQWNTKTNSFVFIGQTHGPSDFEGNPIRGVSFASREGVFEDVFQLDTLLCQGEELLLSLDYPGANVEWNNGEEGSVLLIDSPGIYWAEVQDGPCVFRTDTAIVNFEICDSCTVIFNRISDALRLGDDITLCEFENVQIFVDLDIEAEIMWSNQQTTSSILIEETGSYWAQVEYGECIWATDTVSFFFKPCDSCKYYIPNAFSPQGDGINDVFQVYFDLEACNLVFFKMTIFNRWGGKVFETDENLWDGSSGGRSLDSGLYIYLIEALIENNGQVLPIQEKGGVHLMR